MSFLCAFHDITTNQCLTPDEQYQALLALGLRHYRMVTGSLVDLESDTVNWRAIAGDVQQHNLLTVPNSDVPALVKKLSLLKGACSTSCVGFEHIARYFSHRNDSTVLLTPVFSGKAVTGLIIFTDPLIKHQFSSCDLDNMSLLGRWMGNSLQQQRQKDELEKQRSALARMEVAANIGTWEVDLNSGKLAWSAQTKRIHGVADDYIPDLGSAMNFFKHEEDRRRFRAVIDEALKNGGEWEEEVQLKPANGGAVWVKSFGKAEFCDGVCVRLFGTVQQIDQSIKDRISLHAERKTAQTADRKSRQLLSTVSHELKTPLSDVVDLLKALRFEQDATIREKTLSLALRNADALQYLVNNVLTYCRVTNEQARLQRRVFHPHVMFGELIESYRSHCQANHVMLHFISEIKDNERIDSDPEKIRQIICYLLDHALEYTRQGEITLIVLLRKHSTGSNLLLSVAATGQASAGGQRDTLTPPEPGRRLIQASENGIELATVHALVDQLGGEADVYLPPDGGVNVDIVFPVATGNAMTGSWHELHETLIPARTPIAILVVDDNEINQCVMEAMLARFGLKADAAYDGKGAVRMASRTAYDLIFMDCVMPEMDGLEATRHLLTQRLVPEHCIITAMTANTSEDNRNACDQAGMDAFLTKPVDVTVVKDLVFSAMQNKFHAGLHQAG